MTYERFLEICNKYGLESKQAIQAGRELEEAMGNE